MSDAKIMVACTDMNTMPGQTNKNTFSFTERCCMLQLTPINEKNLTTKYKQQMSYSHSSYSSIGHLKVYLKSFILIIVLIFGTHTVITKIPQSPLTYPFPQTFLQVQLVTCEPLSISEPSKIPICYKP